VKSARGGVGGVGCATAAGGSRIRLHGACPPYDRCSRPLAGYRVPRGAILLRDCTTYPLPGLEDHSLSVADSPVVRTARTTSDVPVVHVVGARRPRLHRSRARGGPGCHRRRQVQASRAACCTSADLSARRLSSCCRIRATHRGIEGPLRSTTRVRADRRRSWRHRDLPDLERGRLRDPGRGQWLVKRVACEIGEDANAGRLGTNTSSRAGRR
jgi:hypothetical protein